jgi:hypothetical protein
VVSVTIAEVTISMDRILLGIVSRLRTSKEQNPRHSRSGAHRGRHALDVLRRRDKMLFAGNSAAVQISVAERLQRD